MNYLANEQDASTMIPSYLIYEELEGIPIYYRNYKAVLNNEIDPEGIIGSSILQSFIVSLLIEYFSPKFSSEFRLLSNELGIHINHKTNLSADLAIYEKKALGNQLFSGKYAALPPKIVFEVDTKAETAEFSDYYNLKTQKLLDFGVEQVIWIYTKSQKVTSATNSAPWVTVNWTDEISVMDHRFSIAALLRSEGISLEQLKNLEEEE